MKQVPENTGLNNDHALLKNALKDDDSGMAKYSVDLDECEEKISASKGIPTDDSK